MNEKGHPIYFIPNEIITNSRFGCSSTMLYGGGGSLIGCRGSWSTAALYGGGKCDPPTICKETLLEIVTNKQYDWKRSPEHHY